MDFKATQSFQSKCNDKRRRARKLACSINLTYWNVAYIKQSIQVRMIVCKQATRSMLLATCTGMECACLVSLSSLVGAFPAVRATCSKLCTELTPSEFRTISRRYEHLLLFFCVLCIFVWKNCYLLFWGYLFKWIFLRLIKLMYLWLYSLFNPFNRWLIKCWKLTTHNRILIMWLYLVSFSYCTDLWGLKYRF